MIVWFFQISRLFTYLRENHPDEYTEMGQPTLFMNNTPKNNVSFLRFILSERPSELNDELLEKKCKFLKRFFYTYIGLFGGLIVLFFVVGNGNS